MAASFGAYGALLSDPRARAFTLAGFVARMPIAMVALSVVLLVTATTGSYGRAGVITAVATVTGAFTAPLWGRLIDRIGQARVLIAAALLCNISLALLAVTVVAGAPLLVSLVTAVGVGLGFSSAGSCVRARWSHRLQGGPLLNTAYAWEAVVDELVFIVGPVLATFLATSAYPAAGVGACVLLGLIGALALARLRDTEPPLGSSQPAAGDVSIGLPVGPLIPIVVASAALGALFGSMELVVVAFAKEADVLPYMGLMIMVWAFGSLVAGLLTGAVDWAMSATRRFRLGAVLLACSVLPLPFASHPVLVTVLLLLSGFFIAPTLIAAVAVTQEVVPVARLTEALGWSSMGMATGVAAGAAGAGQILDLYDSRAGFWVVVGIGALLILSAACLRTPPEPASVEPASVEPASVEPSEELERS
ncbi:MAG TPA: MFS transporter [Propionibacteriaceae bacterium]|nr:MFS transporter [Propionibacteriaceae bacterium]